MNNTNRMLEYTVITQVKVKIVNYITVKIVHVVHRFYNTNKREKSVHVNQIYSNIYIQANADANFISPWSS